MTDLSSLAAHCNTRKTGSNEKSWNFRAPSVSDDAETKMNTKELLSQVRIAKPYPARVAKFYFFPSSNAACAAANLAMGTRNGEQLT